MPESWRKTASFFRTAMFPVCFFRLHPRPFSCEVVILSLSWFFFSFRFRRPSRTPNSREKVTIHNNSYVFPLPFFLPLILTHLLTFILSSLCSQFDVCFFFDIIQRKSEKKTPPLHRNRKFSVSIHLPPMAC